MLQNILSWVWIASGLLLIVSVLLHSPKGDGMGGLARWRLHVQQRPQRRKHPQPSSPGPCWPCFWDWR
jgi:hypothetical protein